LNERKIKCELFNDNFQNFKRYGIPKAQLVIADIPYNLGKNAYASSPEWYIGGITRMEKAKRRVRAFLTQTTISTLPNTSTFATGF
jgi:site-specific DNA-methyltransferase (adenine-specific)